MKIIITPEKHLIAALFSLLLLGISVFLYSFAPESYSNLYCTFLLVVYLISSIITVRYTLINNNYLNFHVLFLLSFFFVNFVYPVFLYPQDPFYFPVFELSFDHQIITKTTALALLGACSYNFGVLLRFRKEKRAVDASNTNFAILQFLLSKWVYFIFIIILIFAGKEMLHGNFGATSKIPPGLLVIFQVSIGVSVILIILSQTNHGSILKFLWKSNKPVLLILFCFILLFIYTGDRGPVLQILLIAIGGISLFIKTIKIKSFIIVILFGMLVFTFISYARSRTVTDDSEKNIAKFIERGFQNIKLGSFFDLGMDLIVNNRNLYSGVEYAKENGFNHGKFMFYYLFSPIPFLPSLMTSTFANSEPFELTSAQIITDEANASYGLGSNMIADLYMAFGVLGVIVFMFYLGYIVTTFQLKALFSNHHYYIIVYLFLLSFSIYLPRTSILDPIRHVVWAIILFFILKKLSKLFLGLSKKSGKPIMTARIV